MGVQGDGLKSVCVFSSSRQAIDAVYFQAASELASGMAERGWSLVFGAGCIGLMGEMARAMHARGGCVVGVIPEYLRRDDICYEDADELIVTPDLRERKAVMESRADAFIGLPGGFGTLEEMLEIITLKQLGQHAKPVVFLNVNGFYDGLASVFQRMYEERFARSACSDLYEFAASPAEALDVIQRHAAPVRM